MSGFPLIPTPPGFPPLGADIAFGRSPGAPKPREKLFGFLRGHDRILCELVDHGPVYGVEAQFFYNEELRIARTFPPYLSGSRTSREMAIMWAEAERKAIEASSEGR